MRKIVTYSTLLFSVLSCQTNEIQPAEETVIDKPSQQIASKEAYQQYGVWTTSKAQGKYLDKTGGELAFTASASDGNPVIEVDSRSSNRGQYLDGFGYTLTGGSAELLSKMSASNRSALLNELFNNTGSGNSKNDVIRVSIGGEDLSRTAYTLNDLPSGQTDLPQSKFSLSKDYQKIDILKQIVAINKDIKIIATPWSAPAWMKTQFTLQGASLKADADNNNNQYYFSSYADYFVKYIQQMQAQGIPIFAVTPQNEPLNPYNTPSMLMQGYEQANFIKYHLGPKLRAAGLSTKIIAYDHNPDDQGIQFVQGLFSDAVTKSFIHGTAWHLYSSQETIDRLTNIRNLDPSKGIYFTEQWLKEAPWSDGDLLWHFKYITLGAINNWSKTVMEWNLASDVGTTINTNGGCSDCMGAITLNGNSVTRNVTYYTIAHASRFLGHNAQRLFIKGHSAGSQIQYTALVNDQAPYARVMLIMNDGGSTKNLNLKYIAYDGSVKYAKISVPAQSIQTYVWRQ